MSQFDSGFYEQMKNDLNSDVSRRLVANTLTSHQQEMLAMAKTTGEFSKDNRTKVGAVATHEKRIIGTGRNGFPAGFLDARLYGIMERKEKNSITVHAEANLIAYCARHGVTTKGAQLYVTYPPCNDCCKLIITAGFSEVYYLVDWETFNPSSEWLYRYKLGLAMLRSVGINVYEISPDGSLYSVGYYDPVSALIQNAKELRELDDRKESNG